MSQQKGKVLYKLGIDENYMYSLTPRPIRAPIDLITKFLGYEDRNQCMVCIMGMFFSNGDLTWLMDYVSINSE